jgi:hypothetical protein
MKRLLTLTAILEAATGLGLIAVPILVVGLLFGAELIGVSIPVARVTGIALIALGVACWLARSDTQSRAAEGLVVAMLLYNVGTVAVLTFAGAGLRLQGMLLWPAVVLHAVMAVWCAGCLRRSSINVMD